MTDTPTPSTERGIDVDLRRSAPRSARTVEPSRKVALPELFKIHKGYEWAHIFIDESTGTFAAVSSFGNFAHIWTHRGGETLKEFVRDLDYDYFFGKTAHTKGQVFSAEETTNFAKQQILEYRRQAYWSKEDCREAWNDLLEMDDSEQDSRTYFEQFTGSDAIMKLFGDSYWKMGCNKRDPQCEGFWTEIWPDFLAAARVSDGSREAGETEGLDQNDDSAVCAAETPFQIPHTEGEYKDLIETVKARAEYHDNGGIAELQFLDEGNLYREVIAALEALQQKNKELEEAVAWRNDRLETLNERDLAMCRELSALRTDMERLKKTNLRLAREVTEWCEEAERKDKALRAIKQLGLGPDQGSSAWQAQQAHHIARSALSEKEEGGSHD